MYKRLTDKEYLNKPKCFNCEHNYSNCTTCEWHCVDGDCFELRSELNRLVELEDKIEKGTLIKCNPKLIGECIVGIHQYTDGTYAMDSDEENIVIGFCSDGIVTVNTTHAYNDYFKHGLYFIDNEEGRAEAEQKLKELKREV